MPSLTYISAVVVLPTLSAIGVLTTWKWSYSNHLFGDIVNVVESPNPCLPGTSHALVQWTSFPPLDRFLAILVTFFYPPINGSNPTAALQAFHFAGQLIAMWTLILLESVRPMNQGRLTSRVALIGMVLQFIDAAMIVPLYCAYHLLTSLSESSLTFNDTLLPKIHHSRSISWSIAIGMIVPAVCMSLPTSTYSQQLWIVIWQFFPILVSIAHVLLSYTLKSYDQVDENYASTEKKGNPHARLALMKVYDFAVAVSTFTHIITVIIAFTNRYLPSLFPLHYHGEFHISKVLIPRLSGRRPIYSIAEGAMMFMQWDETISLLAMLLWSLCLLFAVAPVDKKSIVLRPAGRILARFMIIGPASTVVDIFRRRDAIALDIVPEL